MAKSASTMASISNFLAPVIPVEYQMKGLNTAWQVAKKFNMTADKAFQSESALPDVTSLPLDKIDVSNPFLWKQQQSDAYFKRLRDECPVHYQQDSAFGPFWSVTRFEDILYVDKHHDLFSAEPIIFIGDLPKSFAVETFIAMDPPRHDLRRRAVQEVVAPNNLAKMEAVIRGHVIDILDTVPTDSTFDWVDTVSKELTTRMLATIFDFPYEMRHKLPEWSDLAGNLGEGTGGKLYLDDTIAFAPKAMKAFSELWYEKARRKKQGEPKGFDLISLMLNNHNTQDMINRPMEFFGNIMLLIVGGNDTTRNSITGGVYALNQFPDEFRKLKANPGLIPNMVSEIIRWQTPLAYMRRVAKQDVQLNGQRIKKGDKVVMWYASGNRDERVIANPDNLIIDRKNARNHLAFGFGIHRCMGNRLAEMQLRILWEEIVARFEWIEVVDEPERIQSNFVRGYKSMKVKVFPK